MKFEVTAPDGSTTSVDTELLPVYRWGVTAIGNDLAVVLGYPSATGLSNIKLMAVEFPAKQGMDQVLTRVAKVALTDDTGERLTEAIKAVINMDVRTSEVESLQSRCVEMVKLYHTHIRKGIPTQFEDWSILFS